MKANYEQLQIDKILDSDVQPYNGFYRLQFRSDTDKTTWLNITREELFQIKKVLADKL